MSLHGDSNTDFNGFKTLGANLDSGDEAYRAMNKILTAPDHKDRSLSESVKYFLASLITNFQEEGALASDLIVEKWTEISVQRLVGPQRGSMLMPL